MELRRFLEKLASDSPTPGGGSASALAGALSASLVSMVAGLSLKKSKLPKEEVGEIRKKAQAIQKRLFRAIEEDAKSYEAVLKAFRLPKNTEEERLHRINTIQKAYKNATITPQLVCEHSIQLLKYSEILILKGNPNAISDSGVAAFLAHAAVSGGLLNININLISSTDKIFKREIYSSMRHDIKMRDQMMGRILKTLNSLL